MWFNPLQRRGVVFAFAVVCVAAIPLTQWWWRDHARHPYERAERERAEVQRVVTAVARRDLACDGEIVVTESDGVWAHGCGKRVRYRFDEEGPHRASDVVSRDAPVSDCVTEWSVPDELDAQSTDGSTSDGSTSDGSTSDGSMSDGSMSMSTARTAAERVHGRGHRVRVRFDIAAFGIQGLAKLRYGPHVDAWLEPTEVVGNAVDMPCLDPTVDGGFRATQRCPMSWDHAIHIADCN